MKTNHHNHLYTFHPVKFAMIKARVSKIEQKEKQLSKLEENLMEFKDKTSLKSLELASLRESEKSGRLANVRHRTHKLITEVDSVLRPPDQSCDIRTYSKMDLDIWKYEDVRLWFNKNAPHDSKAGEYCLRPADTGYVIKIN